MLNKVNPNRLLLILCPFLALSLLVMNVDIKAEIATKPVPTYGIVDMCSKVPTQATPNKTLQFEQACLKRNGFYKWPANGLFDHYEDLTIARTKFEAKFVSNPWRVSTNPVFVGKMVQSNILECEFVAIYQRQVCGYPNTLKYNRTNGSLATLFNIGNYPEIIIFETAKPVVNANLD
jgi:hypothetical protein